MDLKRIVAALNGASIENLEAIAQRVDARTQGEFDAAYASEIARQRLARSGLPYERIMGDFPLIIRNGKDVLVSISPRTLLPDNRKSALEGHVRKVKRLMETHEYDGVVYFLPFQMNGVSVRGVLERALPVEFVNLPYDGNSLDRRFQQYHRG